MNSLSGEGLWKTLSRAQEHSKAIFSEETAIFKVSGEGTALKIIPFAAYATHKDPEGLCPTESSKVENVQQSAAVTPPNPAPVQFFCGYKLHD